MPSRHFNPAEARRAPATPPLLIDIYRLSVLLDRSVAALNRDQAAGRLPAPVRIGGSRKWRRDEIDAWVNAGCPHGQNWESLRHADRGTATV